jgi:hypothetical protein
MDGDTMKARPVGGECGRFRSLSDQALHAQILALRARCGLGGLIRAISGYIEEQFMMGMVAMTLHQLQRGGRSFTHQSSPGRTYGAKLEGSGAVTYVLQRCGMAWPRLLRPVGTHPLAVGETL